MPQFDKYISNDKLTSSEESGVKGSKETKASGSSTLTSKHQPKGPKGKTVTEVGQALTTGLLVAARSIAKLTTTPVWCPRTTPTTRAPQIPESAAKASKTESSSKASPRVAKVISGKDTVAKAFPTISTVPLPCAWGSSIRRFSESQTS